MKRFFKQVFSFLACLLVLAFIVFYSADGRADGLYLKFTTPKKSSMILGTSKAAQGLQPAVFNEVLNGNDIYNYAFTVVHSPYGPAYFRSIKSKISKNTKDGTFIVTVDPYSIASRTEQPDDSLNFRENRSAVGKIKNVSTFPNFNYLLFHYPNQYIYLLTRRINYVNQGFLHDDGWVQTNLSVDSLSVKERTVKKIERYKKEAERYNFSPLRLTYLEKTIEYLEQYGKVYVVRLPVNEAMLEIENEVVPGFDEKMTLLCQKRGLGYLNLTQKAAAYTYEDGNHLDEISGRLVSKEVAEWIKNQ